MGAGDTFLRIQNLFYFDFGLFLIGQHDSYFLSLNFHIFLTHIMKSKTLEQSAFQILLVEPKLLKITTKQSARRNNRVTRIFGPAGKVLRMDV